MSAVSAVRTHLGFVVFSFLVLLYPLGFHHLLVRNQMVVVKLTFSC